MQHARNASDSIDLSSLRNGLAISLDGDLLEVSKIVISPPDDAQTAGNDSQVNSTLTSSFYAASCEIRCLCCQAIEEVSQMEPCGHHICARCASRLLVGDEATKGQHIICPTCKKAVEKLDPPLRVTLDAMRWSHMLKPKEAPARPGVALRRSVSNSSVHSGVVRVSNFPATIRATELEALVEPQVGEVSIHILQDRDPFDGRTISPLFIEILDGVEAAERVVETLNGKRVHGWELICELSSQEEQLEYIFPSWEAGFSGSHPMFLFDGKPFEGNFLSEDEIHGMLELCKLESTYASLAPERPFLNIATILHKMPWRAPYLYSPTFATSLMATALGALDILFSTAKDRIPDYLDVATKLAQSIYDCPAASAATEAGIAHLLGCYWPQGSPTSIRIPAEPFTSIDPPSPSPVHSTHDNLPISPEADSMHFETPLTSNRPSLDGKYSPPAVNTERSYARRRPEANNAIAAIAHEFGVDEELVRAIVRRLR